MNRGFSYPPESPVVRNGAFFCADVYPEVNIFCSHACPCLERGYNHLTDTVGVRKGVCVEYGPERSAQVSLLE